MPAAYSNTTQEEVYHGELCFQVAIPIDLPCLTTYEGFERPCGGKSGSFFFYRFMYEVLRSGCQIRCHVVCQVVCALNHVDMLTSCNSQRKAWQVYQGDSLKRKDLLADIKPGAISMSTCFIQSTSLFCKP